MQFDAALAAQDAFSRSEPELDSDWDSAVELEDTFSSNAGSTAREAYEGLLALSSRHPQAHAFQAFCIYITWQQVTEETIAHHFQTGMRLSEVYLGSVDWRKRTRCRSNIGEIHPKVEISTSLIAKASRVASCRVHDTFETGDSKPRNLLRNSLHE